MEHIIFIKQLTLPLICGLACLFSVVICTELSSTYVTKGGEFNLLCEVAGLTGALHLWYKDGKPIKPDSNNKFHLIESIPKYNLISNNFVTLMTLKVDHADSIHSGYYKCNITGPHEHHVIVVTDDMIVTNEEEPGMGMLLTPGEALVLQCKTSECPHCKITWSKNGESLHSVDKHLEIFEKNHSIVIQSATYNDTGVYVCAISHKDPNVTNIINASIVVQSKIKLDRFDASSVVVEGSPLELLCDVQGSPPPTIKWFIGTQEVFDDDNERVKLLENEGLKRGKLLIQEAEYSDRNHYTCEAFNQLDRVNTTVFIRIKDKFAALWPFLGICAEVLILCSIIFIYEEKKKKNSSDEPDNDLPTENKHQRDQKSKGQDVRQRK